MAAANEDRWSIDKLTPDNYATWKFQMKHLLLAKGLYRYVDGTEAAPEAEAAADVKARYTDNSQKAFSTLALSVSSGLVYLISDCDKPDDAWTRLRAHFERDTIANKLFLKKRYFRTVMKDSTAVEQHIKHMKELMDKLAAINAPISEEDQVVTLLGSLPSSYDNVVTALEARVDDLTLDFVHQSLITAEQKRKEQATSNTTPSDAALYLKRKHKGQRPKGPIICHYCDKPNHIAKDCPDRKQPRNKPQHKAKQATNITSNSESSNDSSWNAFVIGNTDNSSSRTPTDMPWIIDSGASRHMTPQKHLFINFNQFTDSEKVGLGDGYTLDAIGIGDVKVITRLNRRVKRVSILHDVLYVPDLTTSLFSVRAATEKGIIVQFGHTRCWLKDKDGRVRAMGTLSDDKLFHLDCEYSDSHKATVAAEIWHRRLAHVNEATLKNLSRNNVVTGTQIPTQNIPFCESCVEGKMSRLPFSSTGEIKSTRKLELVHTDVCTMDSESLGGNKYFVTFIDDYTRCCAVYFLKNKSEVMDRFIEFESQTTNHSGESIGTLRSDRGREYMSTAFKDYLKPKGIR